jgi:hypothetical protein
MMGNWRSKILAWWVTVAVLILGIGYFGLWSDLLGDVYAAPVGSSHATAERMSPIFTEKLEHSIKEFSGIGFMYTGVPGSQDAQTEAVLSFNPVSACVVSVCLGSGCALSVCIGSG